MEPAICGRCGGLVEARAARCNRCGRRAPALLGLRPALLRLFPVQGDLTRATVLLLVAIYLVTMLVAQRRGGLELEGGMLGALSPDGETLFDFGMLAASGQIVRAEPWRLLTYAFLHGGLLHVLFNAMALNSLGRMLEHLLGSARFVVVYVLAALGGGVACLVFAPNSFVVGASGAIFGLNGALIAYGHRRGGTVGAELRATAWRWLIASFLVTSMISNVSHAGHAGGAVVGGLAAYAMRPRAAGQRESDGALLAGLLCLALVVASGAAAALAYFTSRGA